MALKNQCTALNALFLRILTKVCHFEHSFYYNFVQGAGFPLFFLSPVEMGLNWEIICQDLVLKSIKSTFVCIYFCINYVLIMIK